jgi:hypothetical protein
VLLLLLLLQVIYVPVSFDRDHEVDKAQEAVDEAGRAVHLHVQVRGVFGVFVGVGGKGRGTVQLLVGLAGLCTDRDHEVENAQEAIDEAGRAVHLHVQVRGVGGGPGWECCAPASPQQ